MSDKLEVVKAEQAIGPADMLQAVMQKGITAENVEVFKQIWAMNAEREFAAAFVKLQSELPTITASTVNAAYSLNRGDSIGSLESGKVANFVIFDYEDYRELAYWFGMPQTHSVYVRGECVPRSGGL